MGRGVGQSVEGCPFPPRRESGACEEPAGLAVLNALDSAPIALA